MVAIQAGQGQVSPERAFSSDSATRRIRKTGCLDSSRSSICHSEPCLSLREIPPTISAQTLVNSFHAASRSASRCPGRKRRNNGHFGYERNRGAWHYPTQKDRSPACETPQHPLPVDCQSSDRSTPGATAPCVTRRVRAYSLSVIRIRPSPVTTGPFAVTMTKPRLISLAK